MMFDAWPAAPEIVVSNRRAGRRQSTFWNDQKFEIAMRLWAEGNSASEIANEIGTTRNAVLGKLHRCGEYRRQAKRVTGLNNGSNGKLRGKRKSPTIRAWQIGALATDLPPDHADKPTELHQLEPHQCRWPCSGEGYQTLFCGGDVVSGYPYCARHCRMAYTPDPRPPKSNVVYWNSNGAKAA